MTSHNRAILEIDLPQDFPEISILACGSQSGNRVCLTKSGRAYLSEEIKDLSDFDDYLSFVKNINELRQRLAVTPAIIAYDLHPEYLSSKYALEQEGAVKIGVQHHHAHLVSAMIEYGLEGKVIGVAFDGTGLGTDGRLWGGEFMIAERSSFERKAHLAYRPMPGGSRAVMEPWRMAVSCLYNAFGNDIFNLDIPLVKHFRPEQIQRIISLIDKGLNSPLSSSAGRLFDAVSSILRLKDRITQAGEAAILLEKEIDTNGGPRDHSAYPWEAREKQGLIQIDTNLMIKEMVHDLIVERPTGLISARFHNTMVDIIRKTITGIRDREGHDRVVLSGGVFNNRYLREKCRNFLSADGFIVYVNRKLPVGDGNIALGQAVIAAQAGLERDPHASVVPLQLSNS